jgi:hypothetical protein
MRRILFVLLITLTQCQPESFIKDKQPDKPMVIIGFTENGQRLALLLSDMKLRVRFEPPDEMPQSHLASASVWVGNQFPYDKAIDVISVARNYYKEMRYIALSEKSPAKPVSSVHNELFLGGSTETALRWNLKAWTENDFKALKKVKSQDEFHALIRSHYK